MSVPELFTCVPPKQAYKHCPARDWRFEMKLPKKHAKSFPFPGAWSRISCCSFPPHLSEASLAGFLGETQRSAVYLDTQKEARGGCAVAFGKAERWGGPRALPNVCSRNRQALEPRAE